MSYDLMLAGEISADARTGVWSAVQALPGAHCAELTPGAAPSPTLAAIGFSSGAADADVSRLYRSLVALAKERGFRVHDPQIGQDVNLAAPGEHPPGWVVELTLNEARMLSVDGHLPRLLSGLHRLRDVNATHSDGRSFLAAVLSDGTMFMHVQSASKARAHKRLVQDVALALLSRGANPIANGHEDGRTALRLAVEGDFDKVVAAIVAALGPEELTAQLSERLKGSTLLAAARRRGASRIEKLLVKAGAKR